MGQINVVLFLGAGFSKQFGLPTMIEFPDHARGHPKVGPDAAQELSKIILEARQANSFLKSHPRNIEDILSFTEMSEQLGLNPLGRASTIKRILQAVYSTSAADFASTSGSFGKFIDYPADRRYRVESGYSLQGLSIITTNYDLNPELVLNELEEPCRLGCKPGTGIFRIEGTLYSQNNRDAVPIFKLHGAVNWFAEQDDDEMVCVNGVMKSQPNGSAYPAISEIATPDEGSPDPVIVPPSFLKPELTQPMRSVWAGAADKLAVAHYLVFVGYSFPETDTATAYFLASSLWQNASLREIIIVDPSADRIVERLKGAGSRYGNHFTDLLRPVSRRWAEHDPKLNRIVPPITFNWRNGPFAR